MKKELNLKIEYSNEFDVAILDNDFFNTLLEGIKEIKNKEETEKTTI